MTVEHVKLLVDLLVAHEVPLEVEQQTWTQTHYGQRGARPTTREVVDTQIMGFPLPGEYDTDSNDRYARHNWGRVWITPEYRVRKLSKLNGQKSLQDIFKKPYVPASRPRCWPYLYEVGFALEDLAATHNIETPQPLSSVYEPLIPYGRDTWKMIG